MKITTLSASTSVSPMQGGLFLIEMQGEAGDDFSTTPQTLYLDNIPLSAHAIIRKFTVTNEAITGASLKFNIVDGVHMTPHLTPEVFTTVDLATAVTSETDIAPTAALTALGKITKTRMKDYFKINDVSRLSVLLTGDFSAGKKVWLELAIQVFD